MDAYVEYLYKLVAQHGLSWETIEYYHSLYKKLVSREYMENVRSSTKEGILENLLDAAEKFDVDTLEGSLASVFILHQVAEEWLFDLLELIRFYIDLKMFPDRLSHRPAEKLKLFDLICEIENSIDFEDKEDLVRYGKLLNQNRNKIAHALLKRSSLDDIKIETDEFHKNFDKLYEALEGSDDDTYGASEELLERIKSFHKWSDEFYDKYRDQLIEILESDDIDFLGEEEYDDGSKAD